MPGHGSFTRLQSIRSASAGSSVLPVKTRHGRCAVAACAPKQLLSTCLRTPCTLVASCCLLCYCGHGLLHERQADHEDCPASTWSMRSSLRNLRGMFPRASRPQHDLEAGPFNLDHSWLPRSGTTCRVLIISPMVGLLYLGLATLRALS